MSEKDEQLLIAQVEVDFLPINDVFRQLHSNPEDIRDLDQVTFLLNELMYFMQKAELVLLKGPEMVTVTSIAASIKEIKSKWLEGSYEDVNYMYWLDVESNHRSTLQ